MCWGSSTLGQNGTGALVSIPTNVGSGTFTRISAGANHTCAVSASGTVSCWGANLWGQLGNGNVSLTAALGAVSTSLTFKSVSAGNEHTCGVATDNETYCWGSNVLGSLGNELQAAYRATPQKVAVPR